MINESEDAEMALRLLKKLDRENLRDGRFSMFYSLIEQEKRDLSLENSDPIHRMIAAIDFGVAAVDVERQEELLKKAQRDSARG